MLKKCKKEVEVMNMDIVDEQYILIAKYYHVYPNIIEAPFKLNGNIPHLSWAEDPKSISLKKGSQ